MPSLRERGWRPAPPGGIPFALGKALRNLRKQGPYLGALPGKRQAGAPSGVVIYSLTETAEEKGLHPRRYLASPQRPWTE